MFEFCGENYKLKIDEKGILGGKFGGGSFWAENYNKMMTKINENRPENSFYFTESNADAYIKSFDGYLTWMWVQNGLIFLKNLCRQGINIRSIF